MIADFNKHQDTIQIDDSLAWKFNQISYWADGANTVLSINNGTAYVTLENYSANNVSADMFNFT